MTTMTTKKMMLVAAVAALSMQGLAFEDAFKPGEFFVGCNFWGSQHGPRMWVKENWNEKEIVRDLDAMQENGVEMMRVFPTWDAFQPVIKLKKWQGSRGEYLDSRDWSRVDPKNVAMLDEGAMARFKFFCDECQKRHIKLMVSLITGWMSGRLFAPEAVQNLNLITDPEALMWEGRFARYFVRAMKYHPAISCWDLGNECNCMGPVKKRAEAWNWLNTISSAIRMEDPSRPVISGMHGISSSMRDDWNLQMQSELLDYLTPHPYPAPWRVDANRGKFTGFRNALHQTGLCLFYEGVGGKRAFPQEVGSFGPTIVPDKDAADGYRQEMFACWQHGHAGFLWWCAFQQMNLEYPPFDTNAMERELGMVKPDANRTPMPQALALKEFKAFKDSLPFKALPARKIDAVCLLSEYTDYWHHSFGAFLLASQAGISLKHASAEAALPGAKLYIMPSDTAWETYTKGAWNQLLKKAEDGATVIIERGDSTGYSTWKAVTGLEQTLYREAKDIRFEFEGKKMNGGRDTYTALQKPENPAVKVIARDTKGNPVITTIPRGKGKVIVINFNMAVLVHRSLMNTVEGDFSNELWRIYAWAGREAGIQPLVTRASTHLVVTEHPIDATKSIVCALNTNADKEEYEIKVNGKVGKVWNGTYADGKLKVRHNDGCIFEVIK